MTGSEGEAGGEPSWLEQPQLAVGGPVRSLGGAAPGRVDGGEERGPAGSGSGESCLVRRAPPVSRSAHRGSLQWIVECKL